MKRPWTKGPWHPGMDPASYADGHPGNARLIAAAPDLCEALGKCLGELGYVAERAAREQDEHTLRAAHSAIKAARAALAKAGGR